MSRVFRKVLLFESVSAVLVAEKILKDRDIPYKLIPVPKHLSSDCGVCIRVNASDLRYAEEILTGKVKVLSIHELSET
jgi:hypothetical protein